MAQVVRRPIGSRSREKTGVPHGTKLIRFKEPVWSKEPIRPGYFLCVKLNMAVRLCKIDSCEYYGKCVGDGVPD